MCFYYDDGYNEFQNETSPKARKEHQCYECGKTILKGEKYHRFSGKFDGEMFSFATCDDCEILRAQIAVMETDDGCKGEETICPYGQLMEEARERFDNYLERTYEERLKI